MPILLVENVTMRFGGLTAIDNVSFTAMDKEITAIIGPNGAGKTTLFNCLTGFYKPTAGTMTVQQHDQVFSLHKMAGHQIVREARLARTFQNIRLFPDMTVLENLLVAQHRPLMSASLFTMGALLGTGTYQQALRAARDRAQFWLARAGLEQVADARAGTLPYGLQRKCEILRALCTDPVLVCLDEPAAGLNPTESAQLNELLQMICHEYGKAILLIEHDMSVVMNISQHIVVIDYGKKIAAGNPAQIKSNAAVICAYLGEPEEEAA